MNRLRRLSILWVFLFIFLVVPTQAQTPLRSGQANLLQSNLTTSQGYDSQTIHTVQIENTGGDPLSFAVIDEPAAERGQNVAPTGDVIRGGEDSADSTQRTTQFERIANTNAPANRSNSRGVGHTICFDGMADIFPCDGVDLLHYLPINEISTDEGLVTLNDVWGWTDAASGREFALLGRNTGSSFIDITDPDTPIFLADLPTQTAASNWRDIKVIQDHAVVVSEASGHGLQIFPLASLLTLDIANAPHVISTDPADGEIYWYDGFGSAHNVVVNEDNPNHVYAVGTDSVGGVPLPLGDNCVGGLHYVDVSDITNPVAAGCFGLDGYTHDAQCVIYDGPDTDYTGREICFNSNEDTLTIVDVTNKNGLLGGVLLSRTTYAGVQYTHQGWLTDDKTRFLMNDELDEQDGGVNTTTYIWDVEDLDAPELINTYIAPRPSIDHNNYFKDNKVYQANYRSGLRILDAADIANGNLSEIAFFDVFPDDDSANFGALWSNYPYFPSENIVLSSKNEGFFIVREAAKLPSGCDAVNEVDWLTVTPLEGQIAASATQSFAVTLDSTGLAAGTYRAGLCIETDDPDNRHLKVDIALTVESGRVSVQQSEILQTQSADTLSSKPLVIDNTGMSPLQVSVNEGLPNAGRNDAAPYQPNPFLTNLPDDPAARREALWAAFAADRQPRTNNSRASVRGFTPCIAGMADIYPCDGIDLFSHMPLETIGAGEGQEGNDIWGWTDAASGREFALMGRTDGTAFIEITAPFNPVYLANLPTQTNASTWRDIKTVNDHAVIVADSAGAHGMQIFDLSKLLTIDPADAPVQLSTDPTDGDIINYDGLSSAHNVAANEETGFVYVVGESRTGECLAGLNMIDMNDPANPTFAGCYELDLYIHDTQCIVYQGDDTNYRGREICFNSAETNLGIVDVTDKANPVKLGTAVYPGGVYVHQGWITDDHNYFVMNDELDEQGGQPNTRSFVMDVSNLLLPVYKATFSSTEAAIDHNLYIKGNLMYQTNYRAGLRIIDITDIASGVGPISGLEEVAFFDIYPADNNPSFNGSWSNYPYFESGVVIVSGIENGLFVLKPHETLDFCDHPTDVSWLSVAPASGTVAVDGSMTMDVTFNSADLEPGTYTAQLCIDTDDTTNPHLSVPVSLTVDNSVPLAVSSLAQETATAPTFLVTSILMAACLGTLLVTRRRTD